MTTDQETWQEQLSSLPIVPVDESATLLVLNQGEHVLGWAIALPTGDACVIRTDSRNVIHVSLDGLLGFWCDILDCEVGLPRCA